jgi:hypothetical protein
MPYNLFVGEQGVGVDDFEPQIDRQESHAVRYLDDVAVDAHLVEPRGFHEPADVADALGDERLRGFDCPAEGHRLHVSR